MTRVAIAARSEVARAGLSVMLEQMDGVDVVATAATPEALASAVRSAAPDVVVVESNREDDDDLVGIAVAGGAEHERLPGIVLLGDAPIDAHPMAGGSGAGYAVLPSRAEALQIEAAIRAVAAGLIVLHPSSGDANGSAHAPRRDGGAALTPREVEVLRMLAAGLPNKSIARRLGVSAHTIKFHVGSIMAKLHAASRTEAVTEGIRRGLIYL